MTKKQKKVLIRIIISAVLLVAFKLICYLAPVNKYVELVLFLIPYLVIGYEMCIRDSNIISERTWVYD